MTLRKFFLGLVVILIAGVTTSDSHAGLADGLRNYWNFDQNLNDSAATIPGSASTVADNGAFAGANGTDGIAYGAGLFGGAGIEQNGAGGGAAGQENDGYVLVTRSADTLYGSTSTLTTSMWVQTAGFDTSWQTMIAHGEGNQYRIARRGGDPVAAYAGGSGDIPGSAIGPDISAGTGWHHVLAISEAGVDTRLWVDGNLVANGGAPVINDDGNSSPAAPDLFIGANPQTGANNREWWGEIDDVAQWDRALSEAEVSAIFQGGLAGQSLGALIPEPSSAVLSLLAFFGLGLFRRKR